MRMDAAEDHGGGSFGAKWTRHSNIGPKKSLGRKKETIVLAPGFLSFFLKCFSFIILHT